MQLRNAIDEIEAKVEILHTRSRTSSWEAVSERMTSELDRVSTTLNERLTEIERTVQTQSNASPAASSEQTQSIQEDIQRIDSRIEAVFRAFSLEVGDLQERMK